MVEMQSVISTRVKEMGYDKTTATVYVRFKNNQCYQYNNVPEHIWQDFVNSISKGTFINQVLNHYHYHPTTV